MQVVRRHRTTSQWNARLLASQQDRQRLGHLPYVVLV
jgi:hypothetical protein